MSSSSSSAFSLERVESIDSTNSELLRRAETASIHGRALRADVQTAGRGQRGRRWHAAADDALLLSVGWCFAPGIKLDGLSLAAGVAVARAVTTFTRDRVSLKWPNDVLLDDAGKLAGILVETTATDDGGRAVVIGIGVNVRMPEFTAALRADIHALPPAALINSLLPRTADGAGIVCNALCSALLSELSAVLPQFAAHGFAAFRDEWFARRAYADQQVRIFESGALSERSFVGRIDSVTPGGALVVDDGRALHTLHSGALSMRPV